MPEFALTGLTVTKVAGAPDALGESPMWDTAQNCLWWIDGVAGIIRRLRSVPGAAVESFAIGGHIGAITLASRGQLLVTRGHEFLLFDPKTQACKQVLHLEDANPEMRLNDAKLDRQGRLVCVGMGRPGHPLGQVHQLDQRGRHNILASGLQIGNGVCFSPDGRALYYSDTRARKLFICDYDPATGQTGTERLHLDTTPFGSGIDGATVDRDGNLWLAFIHSAEIACFSPDRTLLGRFDAPMDFPSSLCFGGPDMRTLFVTSIRDSGTGRVISQHPDGGHVFAITGTGATGLPEARFDFQPDKEPTGKPQ